MSAAGALIADAVRWGTSFTPGKPGINHTWIDEHSLRVRSAGRSRDAVIVTYRYVSDADVRNPVTGLPLGRDRTIAVAPRARVTGLDTWHRTLRPRDPRRRMLRRARSAA